MGKLTRILASTLALAAATLPTTAQPPAAPPPVVSPDIAASRDVTLRLRAPSAERVELVSGGDIPGVPMQGGLPLTKGTDGVFSVMLPALAPGAYRYRFTVDGVPTNDPGNPSTSESNGNAWSLFYVAGAPFMDTPARGARIRGRGALFFDGARPDAPHARVHAAGVREQRSSYPVFYLLHGAFDGDDSWSTVGRAGFIVDNLIAAGNARPMIVVMPDGHTARFGGVGGGLNTADFVREFTADIKPYIESTYRARTERANTAIAGLSMGGAQTLDIAFADLSSYGYVGVFSSGVFGIADNADWESAHAAQLDQGALKRGLELVWFSTGKDDFLLDTTKATVAMLTKHGFDVVYEESNGGHTWINWREYLAKFAPQLFE